MLPCDSTLLRDSELIFLLKHIWNIALIYFLIFEDASRHMVLCRVLAKIRVTHHR